MRVLIVTQYYPPENTLISPTLARALTSNGHEVRVLTGFPNYPEGRVFDGYRQRWRSRERQGGVDILRVPLWPDHSQNPVLRTLNYLSFGASAATAYGFARGADVIYVYATQMTPALGPWLWRLLGGGSPYVLHVQDLWPDSITGSTLVGESKVGSLVNRVLTPWLRSVYHRAAAVIGIAPTMVRTLVERGVDPAKLHLVYNWAAEVGIQPEASGGASERRPTGADILYAGNIGDMQDLETAVVAASRSADAGVRLIMVGDGVALPRVRALVDRLGATNVEFRGRVPREEIGRHYSNADFALVSLKDLPAFRGTVPSKFQAALANGTPVISTVPGDVRTLVDELAVGFTADTEHPESLEAVFRRAAALNADERVQLAERARVAYLREFSLEAGVAALEAVLLTASRSRERSGPKGRAKGSTHAVG